VRVIKADKRFRNTKAIDLLFSMTARSELVVQRMAAAVLCRHFLATREDVADLALDVRCAWLPRLAPSFIAEKDRRAVLVFANLMKVLLGSAQRRMETRAAEDFYALVPHVLARASAAAAEPGPRALDIENLYGLIVMFFTAMLDSSPSGLVVLCFGV
jgi:hypothetical protein